MAEDGDMPSRPVGRVPLTVTITGRTLKLPPETMALFKWYKGPGSIPRSERARRRLVARGLRAFHAWDHLSPQHKAVKAWLNDGMTPSRRRALPSEERRILARGLRKARGLLRRLRSGEMARDETFQVELELLFTPKNVSQRKELLEKLGRTEPATRPSRPRRRRASASP